MHDELSENFLLDTNVISETVTKRPHPGVMEWLDAWDVSQSFISALTIGEIRKGINRLEPSRKRVALELWLNGDLQEGYKGRILPIDAVIADYWGALMAEYKNHNPIDMIFAATALVHHMTLVTRNEKHFNVRGLRVMNPWIM